jgi:hypothetical protein
MKRALALISWVVLTAGGIASVGVIQQFHGNVYVIRNTKTLSAKKHFKLKQADILRTGNNGWVTIRLKDNTRITAGKNAELIIRDYLYDKSSQSKVTLKFSKGIFKAISGAIGKVARKHFKIHTPTATIGIRGTEFYVRVSSRREQVLCTRGAVVFRNAQRQILLDAGHQLLADLIHQRFETGKISASVLGSFKKSLNTRYPTSTANQKKGKDKRASNKQLRKQSRKRRSLDKKRRTEERLHEQITSHEIDHTKPIVQRPCQTVTR